MAVDYYVTLGVDRDATDEGLKKIGFLGALRSYIRGLLKKMNSSKIADPNCVFTRDGNDLVVTQRISLAESLTGYTVHLTTLDGRALSIPINNVIHSSYEEVVPGEGMPIPKDPSKKGNLRIKFNTEFPARLTSEQKARIRKVLAP
ncbi:uncharacterized protein LOC130724670 [Lotus japonicus]|uniref:uncharacterized protein LOC130724670 n=1 Tax=Lotus japonicus TaxID=34305 RepID=UPI002590B12A|nr:uncharacterized protein LOC130724670 [Lotus japonicus]